MVLFFIILLIKPSCEWYSSSRSILFLCDTAAILDFNSRDKLRRPLRPPPEGGKEGQNDLYGMESEGQAVKK